jgi:hypothetical protein
MGRDVKLREGQYDHHLHREVEESEEQGRTWDFDRVNVEIPEETSHEVEELASSKPDSLVELLNEPFEFMEKKVDTPLQPAPRYGHASCM